MPRLTPEQEQSEAKDLAEEAANALRASHVWDGRWLSVLAVVAVVTAVAGWSAAWAAAALVILAVQGTLAVIQRSQSAASFVNALRECEYRRVMDDIARLSQDTLRLSQQVHRLENSLIIAGVIENPRIVAAQDMARLKGIEWDGTYEK